MNEPETVRQVDAAISEERLAAVLDFLREHTPMGDFLALAERIRAGDRKATNEYIDRTVFLASKETWCEWSGPESPDSICRCLNSLVTQAQADFRRASLPPIPVANPELEQPALAAPLPDRSDAAAPIRVGSILRGVFATPTFSGQLGTAEINKRQSIWTPTSFTVRWRDLARTTGFDFKSLSPAAIEMLDMLARVLIEGKGWGPSDRMRGERGAVALSPSGMSKHGQGHNRRTYQRQYTRLVSLGLLLELRREPGGACVIAPAWWEPHYTKDGLGIWREAARRLACGDDCRSNAADVPQVEPEIAAPLPHHPVRKRRRSSHRDEKGLPSYPLRHSKGRL